TCSSTSTARSGDEMIAVAEGGARFTSLKRCSAKHRRRRGRRGDAASELAPGFRRVVVAARRPNQPSKLCGGRKGRLLTGRPIVDRCLSWNHRYLEFRG